MSIKIQKIIKYIPYVNILVLIAWFLFYVKNKLDPKRFFIGALKFILLGLGIYYIPNEIVIKVVMNETVVTFVTMLLIYVYMLMVSIIAIKDQEK